MPMSRWNCKEPIPPAVTRLGLALFGAVAVFVLVSISGADRTVCASDPEPAGPAANSVDFETQVAPLVIRHCLGCHGSSEKKGGLDLTQQQGWLQGGDSGPAIVPGQPAASNLLDRLKDGSMPPQGKAEPVPAESLGLLADWILAGAPWPQDRTLDPFELTTSRRAGYDWWSLKPIASAEVPLGLLETAPDGWPQNAVDPFILAGLSAKGLTPNPPADRVTLLRRVKFDLLGLPPTPAEIAAFCQDENPDAYARLVDRLLHSPHYGERYARHWLDVVRFGESDGFEHDKAREHAWHYRDYVIRSFNEDKPYAQFVLEQLAGDALPEPTLDSLAATGFLVAGPWDEIQNVGVSEPERMRAHEEQMEELLTAVSQSFLGMSANCARCHDHKFDPIPQADYYRLKAVFDGVDHGNRPFVTPLQARQLEEARRPLNERKQALTQRLAQVRSAGPSALKPSTNATELVTAGKFGGALDARIGHALCELKPSFSTWPIAVECWCKLDNAASFNLLVAHDLKESHKHWELYSYAGTGEFSVYLPGYSPSELRSEVQITDGLWHFVAWTFDGQEARLFVDGDCVKEVTLTAAHTNSAAGGVLAVGSYPANQLGCQGLVDDVRISTGSRDFTQLPEAPLAFDSQTLALWNLDAAHAEGFADSRPQEAAPAGSDLAEEETRLVAEHESIVSQLAALEPPLAYIGVRKQPRPTYVLTRGEIDKPGLAVMPGALALLPQLSADLGLTSDSPESARRLAFARWVTRPENPLPWRVMVNRLWQAHFGRGLVENPSDFGFQSGLPTHAELLDLLAADFLRSGGSIKAMQRRLLTSAAYCQTAADNPAARNIDADNRLLWRHAPRRLEAETARDAMLAVSGELVPRLFGPSFRPFTVTIFNTHFYHLIDADDPAFNLRTIYRVNVSTAKDPLLAALDCPAPGVASPQRRETITPLQALALMNASFVLRQADRLAAKLERENPENLPAQISAGVQQVLGRPATPEELAEALAFAQQQGLPALCWVWLNSSEFLYVE